MFQVEEHFGICHVGEILDMTNAINKCQTCFEGPFPSFPELLKHLAFFHPEILDFGKDDEEDAEVLNPLHPIQNRPKGKATAGQTVKNTFKKSSGGKRPANYEKDNSDKEVDLSNIENDPNEPTYCLCNKVRLNF